jgi:hypothetical protein
VVLFAALFGCFAATSPALAKETPTVQFSPPVPAQATVGASETVTAEASPQDSVTISAVGTACTLAKSTPGFKAEATVSYTQEGQCTLEAEAAETESLSKATVTATVQVTRKTQTIAFKSAAPASATVGGAYAPVATTSSELPVLLTIDPSSSSVCAMSGSTVNFIGAGTCSINANQEGNTEYAAAVQVTQSFPVAAPPPVITIVPGPKPPPPPPPPPPPGPTPLPGNSSFTAGARSFEPATGRVIFIETIKDPGTFSWLLTVPNGKFGVFAARSKCKAGYVRLAGKCRPSKIVFATGSATVPAGVVIFKLRPSPSALKALKNALKLGKGVRVTATFTFQSARGGPPVSHTQTIVDKLKRK